MYVHVIRIRLVYGIEFHTVIQNRFKIIGLFHPAYIPIVFKKYFEEKHWKNEFIALEMNSIFKE